MDAQTFVAGLLPLRGEAAEQFIAEHAPTVNDLDAAVQQLKDEAQAQETRDLELSLIIADQLLTLADWTGNPRHHALGLLARGNVLMRQGHHREAIGCFDAAGDAFLRADDEIGWARTRISYLWSASKTGLAEQAIRYAEQAQEIFVRYSERKRAGDLAVNLALTLTGVGRYQEALAAYNRALEEYSSVDAEAAPSYKGWVFTNKALVLEMLGDLHGAIRCVQEARAIFLAQGQLLPVATADHNQATLRSGLGQYSAALHLFHQAREYYQQHDLYNMVAYTNANMADCLLRLNRGLEALHLAEEATAIYHALDEKPNLGWALIYLARAQAVCGKMQAALSSLRTARELFESIGAVATTGQVLLTQAELLLPSRDQAHLVLACTQEALAIFRAHQMESWTCEAHLLQGRTYEQMGNLSQAMALAQAARDEARQAHLPWLEFACEQLLGRLAQRQGNLEAAETHYQAALNLLEGLLAWLVRDQRSTFISDKEDVFSALISLSLNRHCTNDALEHLERLKSQVLREYLTRSSDIRLKANSPEEARLLEELQRLRQELHWYSTQAALIEMALDGSAPHHEGAMIRETQIASSLAQTKQQTLLNQYKAEQRRREQAISELLERAFLQHDSSRFAAYPAASAEQTAHATRSPVSVERLADLLPENSVLLEYFFQGNDVVIFTLHPGQRRAEVTTVPGAANRLDRLLPLFRANIDLVAQHLSTQTAEAGLDFTLMTNAQGLTRKLYDVLLRPVESHIPFNGRLIVVPYGLLHTLPFHTLQSEAGYLVERCEVAYLPAAAMLSLQERQRRATPLARDGQGRALVLGHSHNGQLPYALSEAQSIASLLGATPYLDAQATIERLSSAGSACSVIHIAAHGQNRADAPDFSYLQLADGQLNMIDVFNLDLPAELITLSGCETGLAVIGGGDELLGLGRGFLYAGARSLLMSLWRVEDASTAYLMEAFYRGLLTGQSRAGALRGAQQALLKAAREGTSHRFWQHPYFWGAFQLLGDADTIPL